MAYWLFRLSIEDKIYVGLLLVVSVILATRYRNLTFNLKPLLALSLLHLLIELLADYLHFGFTPALDNVFLYHLLTPLDYTVLAVVFYRTIADTRLHQAIFWSIPVFWLIAGLFILFFEPLTEFNTLAVRAESVLITFWCFQYFRSLLIRNDPYFPEKDPAFWIIVVILFYFLGNFFIFGSLNYFIKNDVSLGQKVYYAGYTFYYLLYGTIGITCLLNFPVKTHD